jgi:hypothetical protein
MHKMRRKSEAQLTGCRSAPCSAFTLGTALQHHPHATERIETLNLPQIRSTKDSESDSGRSPSKYFLRAADHVDYFDALTTTQSVLAAGGSESDRGSVAAATILAAVLRGAGPGLPRARSPAARRGPEVTSASQWH